MTGLRSKLQRFIILYIIIDFLNKMNFSKKMSFSVRKKQFFGKNGNLTTCTWKHCIDGTFFGVIFILFFGKKIIAHRRTKFQTQFSTLTHPFLTFSCQKKSWKGFLSLVTQEKTLVTQRESLLTLWKTLVTQGKTLVTKGNTLVTGGKTLVTKVKTLMTNALLATRVQ